MYYRRPELIDNRYRVIPSDQHTVLGRAHSLRSEHATEEGTYIQATADIMPTVIQ